MKCPNVELRGTGYMWNIIEQKLEGLKPEVKGMRICKDKRVSRCDDGWQSAAHTHTHTHTPQTHTPQTNTHTHTQSHPAVCYYASLPFRLSGKFI